MARLKIILLLIALCFTFKGLAQAKLQIKDAKKNFGFVKKGEVVQIEYDITNAGDQPLIITGTEISCSCTTVDYPMQPIAPAQSAKVIVSFDTKSVYDRQDRIVELLSNDPKSPHKLRYKGIVLNK